MKNTIYFILLFLFACKSKTNNATDRLEREEAISEEGSCYTFSKDSSVVWMNITIADNIASGELVYDLYEKDRNAGTIEGEMYGDTLFAIYNYVSEGIKSAREVVFLRSADTWIEGYAEMYEQGGKLVFKDRSNIKFGDFIVLKESSCDLE